LYVVDKVICPWYGFGSRGSASAHGEGYRACLGTIVCIEAVDESVSVEVSVASSGGSSGNAGSGGNLASRARRKSLGWAMMNYIGSSRISPESVLLNSIAPMSNISKYLTLDLSFRSQPQIANAGRKACCKGTKLWYSLCFHFANLSYFVFLFSWCQVFKISMHIFSLIIKT
jgi:hypothetical protein